MYRQRARHQPQVEGLLNAALTICERSGDSDWDRLRGACVVELGAGESQLLPALNSCTFHDYIRLQSTTAALTLCYQEKEFWAAFFLRLWEAERYLLSDGTFLGLTRSTIYLRAVLQQMKTLRWRHLPAFAFASTSHLLTFQRSFKSMRLQRPECSFAPSTFAAWAQTLLSTVSNARGAGRI